MFYKFVVIFRAGQREISDLGFYGENKIHTLNVKVEENPIYFSLNWIYKKKSIRTTITKSINLSIVYLRLEIFPTKKKYYKRELTVSLFFTQYPEYYKLLDFRVI